MGVGAWAGAETPMLRRHLTLPALTKLEKPSLLYPHLSRSRWVTPPVQPLSPIRQPESLEAEVCLVAYSLPGLVAAMPLDKAQPVPGRTARLPGCLWGIKLTK